MRSSASSVLPCQSKCFTLELFCYLLTALRTFGFQPSRSLREHCVPRYDVETSRSNAHWRGEDTPEAVVHCRCHRDRTTGCWFFCIP